MNLAAQADAFFTKLAAQDAAGVAALCAPGFRIRQNNGDDLDAETALAGLRARLWTAGMTAAYSDVRRIVADRAVTEQHLVTLRRPDGASASCDVCVVMLFDDDGLVTRLDEYMDTAAFAALSG